MKQLHFDSILHIHVMWQVIVIIGEGEGHTVSSLSLGEWWWMNELRREIMKVVESTAMFLSVFGQTKHQQWEFPSWSSPFQVLIVTIIIWYFFNRLPSQNYCYCKFYCRPPMQSHLILYKHINICWNLHQPFQLKWN
jgi:hypothetical protein